MGLNTQGQEQNLDAASVFGNRGVCLQSPGGTYNTVNATASAGNAQQSIGRTRKERVQASYGIWVLDLGLEIRTNHSCTTTQGR